MACGATRSARGSALSAPRGNQDENWSSVCRHPTLSIGARGHIDMARAREKNQMKKIRNGGKKEKEETVKQRREREKRERKRAQRDK